MAATQHAPLTDAQRVIDATIRSMKERLLWYSDNLALVRLSAVVPDLAALPGVEDGVYIMNSITKSMVGYSRLVQVSALPMRHGRRRGPRLLPARVLCSPVVGGEFLQHSARRGRG